MNVLLGTAQTVNFPSVESHITTLAHALHITQYQRSSHVALSCNSERGFRHSSVHRASVRRAPVLRPFVRPLVHTRCDGGGSERGSTSSSEGGGSETLREGGRREEGGWER